MIIKVFEPLTAYVEKTEQKITGLLEFHSILGNKIDGFIPKFEVNRLAVIPFFGFSNITVGNITFSAYCGDGSVIGREQISEEVLYEFINNLRLSEE